MKKESIDEMMYHKEKNSTKNRNKIYTEND